MPLPKIRVLPTFVCSGYYIFNWLYLGCRLCWLYDQNSLTCWVNTILATCFLATEIVWHLGPLPFFCLWLFLHFVKLLPPSDIWEGFLDKCLCSICHLSQGYNICENILPKMNIIYKIQIYYKIYICNSLIAFAIQCRL